MPAPLINHASRASRTKRSISSLLFTPGACSTPLDTSSQAAPVCRTAVATLPGFSLQVAFAFCSTASNLASSKCQWQISSPLMLQHLHALVIMRFLLRIFIHIKHLQLKTICRLIRLQGSTHVVAQAAIFTKH
ncbi:hypothetical protein A7P98_08640 [Eikenella sp. NML080894]|nr:hypothetical protein A7P98_08640 [Eikenella sp. NML080894]